MADDGPGPYPIRGYYVAWTPDGIVWARVCDDGHVAALVAPAQIAHALVLVDGGETIIAQLSARDVTDAEQATAEERVQQHEHSRRFTAIFTP